MTIKLAHAAYPHQAGYLYDCLACEAKCVCAGTGNAECAWVGHHRGLTGRFALSVTEPMHTSTFLNGEYVSQEQDNDKAREDAIKAALVAEHGPVRLVERIAGGSGRVVMVYQTTGA